VILKLILQRLLSSKKDLFTSMKNYSRGLCQLVCQGNSNL
jgi:hypothetical protein